MGRKLSAWLTGALTLEDTLLLFVVLIWIWVCPSARTAGGGVTQPSHAESKGRNASNTMDLTNLRTTVNLGGAARWTKNWTHHVLKQRRVNCVPILSNAPTVRETTKPIQINAYSEDTVLTENGTSRNMPKSITTDSNQSTLQRAINRKYDFEESQSPFPKCAEKPSHRQHHPWDSDTLWHHLDPRTAIVYHLQSSQYFE